MRVVGNRDVHPVNLIRREVLAKRICALVICGEVYFERTPATLRPGRQSGSVILYFPGSIVDQLESAPGNGAFTIHTVTGAHLGKLHADVVTRRVPSFAIIHRTVRSAAPCRAFLHPGPLMIGPEGKPQLEAPAIVTPSENVFYAGLYLGPPEPITYVQLSPKLCAGNAYERE